MAVGSEHARCHVHKKQNNRRTWVSGKYFNCFGKILQNHYIEY